MGRILLSKAEGLSRLVYPALSLYVNRKTCADIDSLLFKFIWKNKREYIKRKTLIRQYSEGGLNVLDFQTLNNIFKINWLKHCLLNNSAPWYFIPNLVFEYCGGLRFLLSCNFLPGKLPVKLANFHKQALDTWKIAFKHNFSPHTCILWNNQHVVHRNKTLFLTDWYIGKLIGKLLSLIKVSLLHEPSLRVIPGLWLDGKLLEDRSCNNVHIRGVFTDIQSQTPISFHRWRMVFPNITSKCWIESNRFFVPKKVRETHLKILHRYYPTNEFIHKFKTDVSPVCSFCKEEVESFPHLFYSCSHSSEFWTEISLLIFETHKKLVPITESMVLFLDVKSDNIEVDSLIKLLCLLGKYHIHKARFLQSTPNKNLFCIELRIFYDAVCKVSKDRKALKTSGLLKKNCGFHCWMMCWFCIPGYSYFGCIQFIFFNHLF